MTGNKNSNRDFLERLTERTEANLHNEQFGVSELAREMGMSRSNLHRYVHSMLKISASQYIRQKRLEKGLDLLRQTSMTVSEVAYKTGFGSVSYFIKCFHDYYGYPPGEVGNRTDRIQNTPQAFAKEKSKRKRWLVWTVIAVFFMTLLLVTTKIDYLVPLPQLPKKETPKIIAVLPMQFEGSDSMKRIAEGIRESLITSLMSNENLTVRTTTSVEQYRDSQTPLKQIASELNVGYVIEIRGFQRRGNETSLQVNLADAVKDKYLWGDSYSLNRYEENFNSLLNQITREIVKNTAAEVLSEGNDFLEKRLTNNLTANRYYEWALSIMAIKNQNEILSNRDKVLNEVLKAKNYLTKAIELDSAFYEAYIRLAHVYIDNLFLNTGKELYLDSGLVMVEKAFSLQDNSFKEKQYRWLLDLKSKYFLYKGDLNKSKAVNEEIESLYDLIDYESFPERTFTYAAYEDYYLSIYNFYRYRELKPFNKMITPALYRNISCNLYFAGFPKIAQEYMKHFNDIYKDSLTYYFHLSHGNFCAGNYNECIINAGEVLKRDSSCYHAIYWIMNSYIFLNDYVRALRYTQLLEQSNKEFDFPRFIGFTSSRFIGFTFPETSGFLYYETGNEQKASFYFNSEIENCLKQIHSRTYEAAKYESHFRLACIYSVIGEKGKALYYLEEVNNRTSIPSWMIKYMEEWPMFDNIRKEPEFQKLKEEFKKKYKKQHDRVAELLREKGEILNELSSFQQ